MALWKPGQSGNPGGRSGIKPFTDALIWASKLPPGQAAQRKGKTLAQAGALAVMRKAAKGDTQAFNAAADRVEGKPAQAIAITDESAQHLSLDSYPAEVLRQVAGLLEEAAETGEPLSIEADPAPAVEYRGLNNPSSEAE